MGYGKILRQWHRVRELVFGQNIGRGGASLPGLGKGNEEAPTSLTALAAQTS